MTTSTLAERLRTRAAGYYHPSNCLLRDLLLEAATRLETLERENAEAVSLARSVRFRLIGPVHPEDSGRIPDLGEHHTTVSRKLLRALAEYLELNNIRPTR